MRTFYILVSLSLLNLAECASAESDTKNRPGSFNSVPSGVALEFADNLNNPFPSLGFLNRHIRDSLAKYPVKPVFKRLFPNIPELVTDDVKDCEPELKIILPLAKFTDPDQFNQVLIHELIHGNTFNTLLPNLVKYFDRIDTLKSNISVIRALMDRKRFDILFQDEAILFHKYAMKIFSLFVDEFEFSRIKGLCEYIISNPQHFQHIEKDYASNTVYSYLWDKLVVVLNAPDEFFFNFPHLPLHLFDQTNSIWGSIVIPVQFYSNIFERINTIINNTDKVDAYYSILNRIRFGPDEPELFENELQNNSGFSESQTFDFIKCASLANKMNLFGKLLRNISKEGLARHCSSAALSSNKQIELQKVFIDILNSGYLGTYYTRDNCDEDKFIEMISKHYKVTSINWSNMSFQIEFTLSSVLNEDYPVPQIINVNPVFNSIDKYQNFARHILIHMDFINVAVLEKFLPKYFEFLKPMELPDIFISGENLKMIVQSESTCRLLRKIFRKFPYYLPRPELKFQSKSLPNILNGPVFPLYDILKVENMEDYIDLKYLKTHEQFEKLEIMTGRSIFSLLKPQKIKNYLEYRQVFKYLIRTEQGIPQIPQKIDESILSLLRIDFPNYFAKLNNK